VDFNLTFEQQAIADAAREVAKLYGPEYWYEKEESKTFPREFIEEIGGLG